MQAFSITQSTPNTNNAKKNATTPMANQKYNSLVLPKRYALMARPQQYKGAKVIMIELINIAIGMKAKTRNNCRANLFIT